MKTTYKTLIPTLLLTVSTLGCNNSSDDYGSLSVSITDAPLDGATEVVVKFEAIELKPLDGESINITFDEPQSIDLLALQFGLTEPLIQNESLEAGDYVWMRLAVDADEGEMDSYISFEDGSSYSLNIPSGNTTGLKLNQSFTIPAGGSSHFTIDFDLRKSVHSRGNNSDDYVLRPTLRIEDNTEVGAIFGYIATNLVSAESCDDGLAVYAYAGADITPDDEGSNLSPLTSTTPIYNAEDDRYDFQISFLLASEYTVAVTCDADNDDPETDQSELDWTIIEVQNITVETNINSELNFE